jgi:pSer/pThr/pTyr-binding forkhead associated (FHA) protein
MAAQIVILTGPDSGQEFVITPGQTFRVGRSATSDTRLSDGTVSRMHCEIGYDGQQARLTNISDKGTLLNGLSINSEALRHGDIIQIGATAFRFQLQAVETAETLLQPTSS